MAHFLCAPDKTQLKILNVPTFAAEEVSIALPTNKNTGKTCNQDRLIELDTHVRVPTRYRRHASQSQNMNVGPRQLARSALLAICARYDNQDADASDP
jgi:hypothetical protein